MGEIELAVHEQKNVREKLNVKHLGNLTQVEKEMDELCNFLSQSGRLTIGKTPQTSRGNEKQFYSKNETDLEKTTPRSQIN